MRSTRPINMKTKPSTARAVKRTPSCSADPLMAEEALSGRIVAIDMAASSEPRYNFRPPPNRTAQATRHNHRPTRQLAWRFSSALRALASSLFRLTGYFLPPNGWRVSGEPGRAQRATRVRCTRGLGRTPVVINRATGHDKTVHAAPASLPPPTFLYALRVIGLNVPPRRLYRQRRPTFGTAGTGISLEAATAGTLPEKWLKLFGDWAVDVEYLPRLESGRTSQLRKAVDPAGIADTRTQCR